MGPLKAAAAQDLDAPAADEVTGLGLLAGLDNFAEDRDDPNSLAQPDPEPEPEKAPDPEPDKEPESASTQVEEEEEEEEIGLPDIGSVAEPEKEDAKPAFDADKYDADTAALLESIDKAGHPGEAFKKMREKLKEFESGTANAPEFESKIAALEAEKAELAEKAAQVEAMQEKVTAISSRNAELLLEENADYQAQVAKPHQEIKETVTALAEAKEIPEKELWSVIMENDPVKRMTAVDALEEKIGGRHALMVDNIATDIRRLSALDKDMRSKASEIVTAAREQESGSNEKELAAKAQSYQTFTKTSFEQYANKIPGFTDDTGNMTDAARMAIAKAQSVDPNTLAPNDLAYMTFATQSLPQALKELRSLKKENRDLKVAAGGAGKDISPKTGDKKPVDDGKPRGFMEGFESQKFTSV